VLGSFLLLTTFPPIKQTTYFPTAELGINHLQLLSQLLALEYVLLNEWSLQLLQKYVLTV
jgi:hypothetical protein